MNRKPLHIALVSEHASPLALLGSPDAGGQNVHVAELARHLGQLGARVTVHTRRDDPALADEVPFAPGVMVHHVTAGPPIPLAKDELLPLMGQFAAGLERRWRLDPPDVVHAHFWMSGLASLTAARAVDRPLALTYHALGAVKRRHQGSSDTSPGERVAIERALACEVDLVIATSADEVDELSRLGMPRDRAEVIPCGVDLSVFRPDGSRAPARSALRRVVSVSRLVERKGIDDVIRAVAMLPGVELLVAGGPPAALLDDDAEARRLEALMKQEGVEDRVRLLGALPRPAVAALLRSADVTVCCPWYEPFGMVAVESMACGTPVVASDVGGLAETVVDRLTGCRVPPHRPDRIAAAIASLLEDRRRLAEMGRAACRRAHRYGWPVVAAQTYGELVGLATGSRAAHATAEGALP